MKRGWYKIAVVGSRTFKELAFVRQFIRQLSPNTLVISGGARGVDQCAVAEARKRGMRVREFLPDWRKHGRSAGFIRNADIVSEASVIVAFWDGESRGTKSTIELAQEAHKTHLIINGKGEWTRYRYEKRDGGYVCHTMRGAFSPAKLKFVREAVDDVTRFNTCCKLLLDQDHIYNDLFTDEERKLISPHDFSHEMQILNSGEAWQWRVGEPSDKWRVEFLTLFNPCLDVTVISTPIPINASQFGGVVKHVHGPKYATLRYTEQTMQRLSIMQSAKRAILRPLDRTYKYVLYDDMEP